MLLKTPKRSRFLQRLFGGFVLFELACCGATYFFWDKLNKNREVREKVRDSAPWALEIYYKIGETISSKNKQIRFQDEQTWAEAQLQLQAGKKAE